jgi:hypothetical protein
MKGFTGAPWSQNIEVEMSTLFLNEDEATCGLDSGNAAFSLVEADTVANAFTSSVFTIDGDHTIANSKLVFN